ncbi:MAG: hypothetical protein LBD55_12480 [Treponema sp.]|nr:hypothetical protein [Treponema sp.]
MARGGEKIQFSRVEAIGGASFINADAEINEPNPRRALIHFTGEAKPLICVMVNLAMKEAENQRPAPGLLIFAYFQAGPAAAEYIEKTNWPGVTHLKIQMNTDLLTAGLKKKSSGSQSFWLIGRPEAELVKISPRITQITTNDSFLMDSRLLSI